MASDNILIRILSFSIVSGKEKAKKGKDSKSKLVGKAIVNLSDFAVDGMCVVKNIPLKSKSSKTGGLDIRFEAKFSNSAAADDDDDRYVRGK